MSKQHPSNCSICILARGSDPDDDDDDDDDDEEEEEEDADGPFVYSSKAYSHKDQTIRGQTRPLSANSWLIEVVGACFQAKVPSISLQIEWHSNLGAGACLGWSSPFTSHTCNTSIG